MRGILILALFIAVCACQTAKNQVIPTFMICGSTSNYKITVQCTLTQPHHDTVQLATRPVINAPYCTEVNFNSVPIVVNGSATVACSAVTPNAPYEYTMTMYDPIFAGSYQSIVGFPFMFEAGSTKTVNFNHYQLFINFLTNAESDGYPYVSSSKTANSLKTTGSVVLNLGVDLQ